MREIRCTLDGGEREGEGRGEGEWEGGERKAWRAIWGEEKVGLLGIYKRSSIQ